MKKRLFWCGLLTTMFLVTGATQVWAAPDAEFSAVPLTGKGRITTFNFTDLSTGPVESWLWEFGDGNTSTSQNPSHQYREVGTYTVRLTVNGDEGPDVEEITDYIEVTMGANFVTNTPREGPGPLPVLFDERCSRPVDTWEWNFGNGDTSTEKDPYYTYYEPGVYTVTMTCSGTGGTDTITKTEYVSVSTGGKISASLESGRAPLTVNFTGSGTTDVTLMEWDFDNDGVTDSTEENPSWNFIDPKVHTVRLTVNGGVHTDTELVVAADPWGNNVTKLASAKPDECFNWLGGELGERVAPLSLDPFTCPPGDPAFYNLPWPMSNQTYVWSQVKVPSDYRNAIVFGTGANVLCTTQGAFLSTAGTVLDYYLVCEFEESPIFDPEKYEYLESPVFDDNQYDDLLQLANGWIYGDWRPAKVYMYDLDTNQLEDLTPNIPADDPFYKVCTGFRASFYHNGVVFMAGGTLPTSGAGVVMFAFNAITGEFIESWSFPNLRTIRKGDVIKNVLYVGAGQGWGDEGDDIGERFAGKLLRWNGNIDSPFHNSDTGLDAFVEVGSLPNFANLAFQPAYGGVVRELTEYVESDGVTSRVAVSAKGVWVSPPIPAPSPFFPNGGLRQFHANQWTRVWSPEDYEPDYITRQLYVGGGIEFLNGWLYFLTMHIPGNAADVHANCSMPPLGFPFPAIYCFGDGTELTDEEYNAINSGTERATSLWRITNIESGSDDQVTELLHGEEHLPQYQDGIYPESPGSEPKDAFPLVATGYVPKLGGQGFDSDCNNYGWVMDRVGDHIFAGTMDYCSIYDYNRPTDPNNPFGLGGLGADLWRISGGADDDPPLVIPETTNAFKDFNYPGLADMYNYVPYGFRTLTHSDDDTKLYLGMATGINLNAVNDGAGWQLLQLDSNPLASCSWDIEPLGDGNDDFDVDGMDLGEALSMPLSPGMMQVIAMQFGSTGCNQ